MQKTRFFRNVTRDEICTFSIFGVHVVKKKHDFLHFFWHFFHFPPHFTLDKKCMTNSKKVHFLRFCPTLLNTKSFFQHFFYIFLTKKISIFNFPPHYNKFHFFCFLCSSYGKQLPVKNVKKVDLFSEKIKKIKIFLLFSKWIEKKINYAHHRAEKLF